MGEGFFPASLLLLYILCRMDTLIRKTNNASRDGKTPDLELRKDTPLDLDGLKWPVLLDKLSPYVRCTIVEEINQ
jgi:hypothetical protein